MTTIILDINQLPKEYKVSDENLKQSVVRYEKDFGVKIIPVDLSRANTQNSIEFLPIVVNSK